MDKIHVNNIMTPLILCSMNTVIKRRASASFKQASNAIRRLEKIVMNKRGANLARLENIDI